MKKLRLKRSLKNHPWIFEEWLDGEASAGELVVVEGCGQTFTGYYNPYSKIKVRVLSFSGEKINKEFFLKKFKEAAAYRRSLGFSSTFRFVFSEADGLPGLTVDFYNGFPVALITTLGMEKLKGYVVDALWELFSPAGALIKVPDDSKEGLTGYTEKIGRFPDEIVIKEGKASFKVWPEKGHKTGFYLDQRENRLFIEKIAAGRCVLDLFCYSGGFGIHAWLGGAKSVDFVEDSGKVMDMLEENVALNGVRGNIFKENAFKFIRRKEKLYDLIILDPPPFAERKNAVKGAAHGYFDLLKHAVELASPGGFIAVFACSFHIKLKDLMKVVKDVQEKSDRHIKIVKYFGQAPDHPVLPHIPQTEYLKGVFLWIN